MKQFNDIWVELRRLAKLISQPIFDLVQFNTSYIPTGNEPIGTRYWDAEAGTTALVRPDGVILHDVDKLEDCADVDGDATTILDTETFLKKESSGVWKHITLANIKANLQTWMATLFVPNARTITINGTTQDLSANRSWTIEAGGGVVDNNTLAGEGTEASPLKISDEYQRRINAGI